MASYTGLFTAIARLIRGSVYKTFALLERPDTTLINPQAGANDGALVEWAPGAPVPFTPPVTVEETGSVSANVPTYYYVDLVQYPYFAVEFLPDASGAGAGCEITMTYQVSIQASEPDIELRSYVADSSEAWFGDPSYSSGPAGTQGYAQEKDTPTPWLSMRVTVDVTGWTGPDPATWSLNLSKMARG